MRENDSVREALAMRDWLAIGVVGISIAAVTVIAVVYIRSTPAGAETVFESILPLVATWVGTVLAFYFGRENLIAANRSVIQMARQLTSDQRLQIPAEQAMVRLADMDALMLAAGETDTSVLLQRLKDIFDRGRARVPILNPDGTARYVIGAGTFGRFALETQAGGAAALAGATLADFLKSEVRPGRTVSQLAESFAVVAKGQSLAATRDKMVEEGAQDAFVTGTGAATEPVLGWITNDEIARRAQL